MWAEGRKFAYAIGDMGRYNSNLPEWSIDVSHAALLVHDMQNYFLNVFEYDNEPLNVLRSNCLTLVELARSADVPVFYTAQPGDMTNAQRGLLSSFWGYGMGARPEHRDIWRPIAPQRKFEVVEKWRYSAFFRNNFAHRLEYIRARQLIIIGVYGHVGILGTAMDSYSRDYETFVVSDAIADFSREEHVRTLVQIGSTCAAVCETDVVAGAFRGALES